MQGREVSIRESIHDGARQASDPRTAAASSLLALARSQFHMPKVTQ